MALLEQSDSFKTMLDGGVQDAYKRQWHRIERGLRLNRLRIFIDTVAPAHNMTDKEKEGLFLFLQKALDKKLLNTLKIVQYDPEQQQILSIKGFEIKRNAEGIISWTLAAKKVKTEKIEPKLAKTAITRKKKVSA
jgi:hypothetical protein